MATEASPDETIRFLTPKMVKYLSFTFRVGQTFGFLPFVWDSNELRPRHGSSWRKVIFHGQVLVCVLHILYLCYQTWHMNTYDGVSSVDKVIVYVYLAICANSFSNQMNLLLFSNEFVESTMIGFGIQLGARTSADHDKTELPKEIRLTELFLDGIYNSLCLSLMVGPMIAVVAPSTPKLILSSFTFAHSGLGLVLSVLVELYMALCISMSISTIVLTAIVTFFGVSSVLNDFKEKFQCPDRPLSITFTEYRKFQVMLKVMNSAFSPVILPNGELGGILIAVFGIFAAFKLEGMDGIGFGLVGMMVLVSILTGFRTIAEHQEQSILILRGMKRLCRSKLEVREIKSLQPIRWTLGSFFHVDKSLILTILDIVASNVVNLLVIAQ